MELNISKTFWYALSNSQILSLLSKISIGVGIVALFALWEKPKPIAIFILLILALVLPAIVSKILNAVIDKQMENFNYSFIQSLAYMIYFPVALVVWTSTKWITTAMLYNKAEKQAKPILISYMIIFAIGLSGSLLSLSYAWTFNQIANMLYPYIYKVATLSLTCLQLFT